VPLPHFRLPLSALLRPEVAKKAEEAGLRPEAAEEAVLRPEAVPEVAARLSTVEPTS
jgi:hypothetical protein